MNKADRLRAFALRCDGLTWEQIADELHYDAQTIAKDLQQVVEKMPHIPAVIYPAILAHIVDAHGGSVEQFAVALGVSPHRLRRVLVHGDEPSESLQQKIAEAVGKPVEEVFARVQM